MKTLIPILKILGFLLLTSVLFCLLWNFTIGSAISILKLDWLIVFLALVVIDAINIMRQLEEIEEYL